MLCYKRDTGLRSCLNFVSAYSPPLHPVLFSLTETKTKTKIIAKTKMK